MKLGLPPTYTRHPMATRLGYLAVLPFVVLTLLSWVVNPDTHPDEHWYVTFMLSSYGAVAVSLLGGIHWGLAFHSVSPTPLAFAWGVVPPGVSWAAALMPPQAGLAVLAVMLVVCYLVDRKIYCVEHASEWLGLRLQLTVISSLSCVLAFLATGPFH